MLPSYPFIMSVGPQVGLKNVHHHVENGIHVLILEGLGRLGEPHPFYSEEEADAWLQGVAIGIAHMSRREVSVG